MVVCVSSDILKETFKTIDHFNLLAHKNGVVLFVKVSLAYLFYSISMTLLLIGGYV